MCVSSEGKCNNNSLLFTTTEYSYFHLKTSRSSACASQRFYRVFLTKICSSNIDFSLSKIQKSPTPLLTITGKETPPRPLLLISPRLSACATKSLHYQDFFLTEAKLAATNFSVPEKMLQTLIFPQGKYKNPTQL